MTKSELISTIQQANLFPIPIKDEGDEELIPSFDGNLKDFLAAALALEAKAILVCSYPFEEADFIELDEADEDDDFLGDDEEDDEDEDDEDEETDDEPIGDLTERFPALAKYKKYIGQDCIFSLTATGGFSDLNLELAEDWYVKFEQEFEEALENEA